MASRCAYETVARTNLKPILDTARTGRLVTVTRRPDVDQDGNDLVDATR